MKRSRAPCVRSARLAKKSKRFRKHYAFQRFRFNVRPPTRKWDLSLRAEWCGTGGFNDPWARSTMPDEIFFVRAEKALPAGNTRRFVTEGLGKPADVILSSGGEELGRQALPINLLFPFLGATLDIGHDWGVPVTRYRTPRGDRRRHAARGRHARVGFTESLNEGFATQMHQAGLRQALWQAL